MKGLGSDIVEIKRIKETHQRHGKRFLNRLFTSNEQNYCLQYTPPHERLAGRFAAKEAISKALGTGFNENLSWQDIEIVNDSFGKPLVKLSKKANIYFNSPQILLSISHCKDYAIAFAIWND